ADVQDVERPDDRTSAEHVLDGERLAVLRLGIEGGPPARGDGKLRPLLERGAVLVNVPGRDEAEVRRRSAEAVRRLELPGDGRVTAGRDTDAGAPRLPVRDDGDVAQAVVQGEHRVADHDDEGAAAHGGAVDEARSDADRLRDGGGGVLARGEDAVDVGDLQAGVAHGVVDRLHVQRELTLAGQHADLVALVDAHDAGRVRQRAERGHL